MQSHAKTGAATDEPREPRRGWSPEFEVICLACEISAYAPDDDTPLF